MKTLYIVGVIAVMAVSSYFGISYYTQKQLAVQLNQVLDETIKEKDQLQASVDQLQVQLKDKEDKLASLSDVQGIKVALTNAQANTENMNKEFTRISRERAILQEANVGLSTRLQNTTKEYMRTIAELKTAQDQVGKLNKEQSPDKKKVDDLNKKIEEKNKELARQKEELDGLKANSQLLVAGNKALDKKLKDLEANRSALQAKLENMQEEVGSRETPARQLQTTIASLRAELSKKEEQIAALEDKLTRQAAEGSKAAVVVVAKGDPKLQKTIDEMRSNNDNLKDQIAQLSEQLNKERARAAKLASSPRTPEDRKFEEVKAEMDRLSGILIKKEFEIDTAKKDALSAKEEMLSLQTKLAAVQDNLYASRVNQEKLKELENQRLSMQSQLDQVQRELLKKNELLESLQKNIDYLTMQVEKKDQEKAALDARLSLLDSSTKNELDKEKRRGEETNQMYNSLKAQISQFSDGIALKEAEIENKRKDISSLREELSSLKTRSAQLENDLLDSKESQKKLMGDLSAAVRLNSVLQERIRFAPAGQDSVTFSSSSDDKRKADELKKKIEVILEPEKQ
jgi:chromosome segregation ATPase